MNDTQKPINIQIEFSLHEGEAIERISITPSGKILIKKTDGSEISPYYSKRTISHDRPKGPKSKTQGRFANQIASINGLTELTKFKSIFIIDTNKRVIDGTEIAAAAFICCRISEEQNGYSFHFEENRLNIFEFKNVVGNPELLAILKLANDVKKNAQEDDEFIIVTDTELGAHDKINSREFPLYKQNFLLKQVDNIPQYICQVQDKVYSRTKLLLLTLNLADYLKNQLTLNNSMSIA